MITSEISFSGNLVLHDKNLHKKYFSKRKNTFFNSPIYIDLKYAIKKYAIFKAISIQKLSSQRVNQFLYKLHYDVVQQIRHFKTCFLGNNK